MARGPRLTCHTPPTAFHPIKPSYPFPYSMLVHLWMYITLNVLNVKIAPKLSSVFLREIQRDLATFQVIHHNLKLELTL